nr:MAG TPA: zinc-ribbon containing domain protein [Caudoviricetes sp.]
MTAAEIQERLVCILNNNQFTRADKKAMYLAINAINKQIPKKLTNFAIDNNGYTIYDCECPNCEQSHRELFPFAFCIHCEQALEWEE